MRIIAVKLSSEECAALFQLLKYEWIPHDKNYLINTETIERIRIGAEQIEST